MEANGEQAWQRPIKAVGIIGLSGLGGKIGRRLLQENENNGLDKIVGFDTDPSVLESAGALGVTPAKSIAHLVDGVDLILLCLEKPGEVGKAARSHDGLLDCISQGQILVDHGWTSHDLTTQLATAFASRGAAFLDAPIGRAGDVDHAIEEGRLIFAVGGDEAPIHAALPLFRRFAETVTHVGAAGTAQVVRKLGDLVTLQTFTALAEALVTARTFGIEGSLLVDALSKGRGGLSGIGRDGLMEFLGDGEEAERQRPTIADAGNRLREAVHLAEQKKLTLASADSTLALLDKAVQQGIGGRDLSGLLSLIEPPPRQRRRP